MDAQTAKQGLRAAPNVTPLVDVVLVLLILFIVMLPAVDAGVRLPKAGRGITTEGEPPVLVLLRKEGGVLARYAEAHGVAMDASENDSRACEALMQRLERGIAKAGGRVCFKADADLAYGQVDEWMTRCKKVGANEVLAVTEPLSL